MKTRVTTARRWLWVVMALPMLGAGAAHALTGVSLRDLADPVPPGGLITYELTMSDRTPAAPASPFCFNPPPECITTPVSCFNPPPQCVGNGEAGFQCFGAVNEGADCGSGDPPVANPDICIARPEGVCNGGPNVGLRCTVPHGELTTECPGTTFLCVRAFNVDAYCGTALPTPPECLGDEETGFFCSNSQNDGESCGTDDNTPEPDVAQCIARTEFDIRPENDFCLANPTGICSGGPNFGLDCDTPHGEMPSEDCPPEPEAIPPPATDITLTLPIPTGTIFFDADNGGTSDGTQVTWTFPPLDTCGGAGQSPCPQPQARLLVDPLTPVGTVILNRATATDGDGFVESGEIATTIGTFGRTKLVLRYPRRPDKDSVVYRTRFTLLETQSYDPATESFRIVVEDSSGVIADFSLPTGVPQGGAYHSTQSWRFRGAPPGLTRVGIDLKGPNHFWLRVGARRLSLPELMDLNVTVTLTLGDDVLVQDLVLTPNRTGRRFKARVQVQ